MNKIGLPDVFGLDFRSFNHKYSFILSFSLLHLKWYFYHSSLKMNLNMYIFLRRVRKNADLLLYHRTNIFSLLFIQQMGTDEISFNNEVNVGSKCGGRSQVHLSISGQPNN